MDEKMWSLILNEVQMSIGEAFLSMMLGPNYRNSSTQGSLTVACCLCVLSDVMWLAKVQLRADWGNKVGDTYEAVFWFRSLLENSVYLQLPLKGVE